MADIIKNPGDSGTITVPEGVHACNVEATNWGGDGGAGADDGMGGVLYGGGGGGGGESLHLSGYSCSPGDSLSYSIATSNLSNSTFQTWTLHPGSSGGIASTGSGAGTGGSGGSGGSGESGASGNAGDTTAGGSGGNPGTTSIGGTGGSGGGLLTNGGDGTNYGAGGGGAFGPTGSSPGMGAPARFELTWATRTELNNPDSVNHDTITEDGVHITWSDNSAFEAGYEIEVRGILMNSANYTAAANATSKSITGLDPGQLYLYQVRAADPGISVYSSWVGSGSFTTDSLGIPDSLGANSVTDITATLVWTDHSTSNDSFDIEFKQYTDTLDGSSLDNTVSTTLDKSSLSPGTHYHFRVRATKNTAAFTSDWSSEFDFYTLWKTPDGFNQTEISDTGAVWAWTYYDTIYRNLEWIEYNGFSDWSGANVVNGDGADYSWSGLTPGTHYQFRVRSRDSASTLFSDWGEPQDFTTTSSGPTYQPANFFLS